jgi:hypothetical protein
MRLGGPQVRSDGVRKISLLPGIDPACCESVFRYTVAAHEDLLVLREILPLFGVTVNETELLLLFTGCLKGSLYTNESYIKSIAIEQIIATPIEV